MKVRKQLYILREKENVVRLHAYDRMKELYTYLSFKPYVGAFMKNPEFKMPLYRS